MANKPNRMRIGVVLTADAHARLGLGKGAFLKLGKYEEAAHQYHEALRINPDFADDRNSLGTVFFDRGSYQEAASQLHEALRMDPNYAEAHNNLATVFFNQGKYQQAIPHLQEALRTNPRFAEVHYNLGSASLMVGNRGLAEKEYEILKTINPGLANSLYQKMK